MFTKVAVFTADSCVQLKPLSGSKSLWIQYMGYYMIYLRQLSGTWTSPWSRSVRHKCISKHITAFKDKYLYPMAIFILNRCLITSNSLVTKSGYRKQDSLKGSLNIPLLYFAYLWDGWAELFKASEAHPQKTSLVYFLRWISLSKPNQSVYFSFGEWIVFCPISLLFFKTHDTLSMNAALWNTYYSSSMPFY